MPHPTPEPFYLYIHEGKARLDGFAIHEIQGLCEREASFTPSLAEIRSAADEVPLQALAHDTIAAGCILNYKKGACLPASKTILIRQDAQCMCCGAQPVPCWIIRGRSEEFTRDWPLCKGCVAQMSMRELKATTRSLPIPLPTPLDTQWLEQRRRGAHIDLCDDPYGWLIAQRNRYRVQYAQEGVTFGSVFERPASDGESYPAFNVWIGKRHECPQIEGDYRWVGLDATDMEQPPEAVQLALDAVVAEAIAALMMGPPVGSTQP